MRESWVKYLTWPYRDNKNVVRNTMSIIKLLGNEAMDVNYFLFRFS